MIFGSSEKEKKTTNFATDSLYALLSFQIQTYSIEFFKLDSCKRSLTCLAIKYPCFPCNFTPL
jgi:hypothetical protein